MSHEFWLQDKLQEILGLYDRITAEFIKAAAKKSSTTVELANHLDDIEFPRVHPESTIFFQEILDRFGNNSKYKLSTEEMEEKIKKEQQRRNKEYKPIPNDFPELNVQKKV
jgi:hypothetical protein